MAQIDLNITGLPRAALLNDLSCFGKCSVTVGLPILSAVGVECLPLPTAVLSTHTGGFADYTCTDMTAELQRITDHWRTMGLRLDAVATGYFCSPAQLDFAQRFIHEFAAPPAGDTAGTLVLVDPVMADAGRLYPGFDNAFVAGMRQLISGAGVITPNLTEALLLADMPYTPRPTPAQLLQCVQKLHALGAQRVIITGVARTVGGDWSAFPDCSLAALEQCADAGHQIGCICSDGRHCFAVWHPYVATALHGCGDVFSAALLAAVLGAAPGTSPLYGQPGWFCRAVPIAVDFTRRCVAATDVNAYPGHWYGLRFETCLAEGFWPR